MVPERVVEKVRHGPILATPGVDLLEVTDDEVRVRAASRMRALADQGPDQSA
jgi:hypothetical protein